MVRYCAFCDNEAVAVVESTNTSLCSMCMDIYNCGQNNPYGCIIMLDDYERGE